MTRRLASTALAALLLLAPLSAAAGNRQPEPPSPGDVRNGRLLALSEIERRVLPRVSGQYLGPEFNNGARQYRLKFIDRGRVIFVDVDATNGRIISQR